MDAKNFTDVLIGGKIYTLGGFVEESYLQGIASYINEKMSQLKKQEGFLKQSADYQSVMLELNMADDYFSERRQAELLERQKSELEKENYSLKHELVSTQMKLENAVRETEMQKAQLKEAGEEIGKLKMDIEQLKAVIATKNSLSGNLAVKK